MLRLAIGTNDRFAVSEIEKGSTEPGYTLVTVRTLKKRFPQTTFDFIIGADLLAELESWYEAEQIVKEVRIVAGSRPGATIKLPDKFPVGAIQIVETSLVDLASHQIRKDIAGGMTEEGLAQVVPAPVAKYITAHGLYR